ncbi:MAG: EMC3/TMCO1 family protein [Candidatus Micrarchaeaceae archaeon]
MLLLLEIVLISVAYVAFSVFLQRKLSNVNELYDMQDQMKVKQKELMEMVKNNASQEELAAKQKELMHISGKVMAKQLKASIIILPIFIILYYVALPMAFPSSSTVHISSLSVNYRIFFFYVVFLLGVISSIVLMVVDRRKAKARKQAELAAQQGSNFSG